MSTLFELSPGLSSILLAALFLASFSIAATAAEGSPRYQLFFSPHMRRDTFLVDTQTGKVWQMAGDDKNTVFQRVMVEEDGSYQSRVDEEQKKAIKEYIAQSDARRKERFQKFEGEWQSILEKIDFLNGLARLKKTSARAGLKGEDWANYILLAELRYSKSELTPVQQAYLSEITRILKADKSNIGNDEFKRLSEQFDERYPFPVADSQ